jgi:hypothetical protein
MKSSHTLGTLIAVLKADVKELIDVKLELARLEVFEKSSVAGSFLIYGLVIINVIFFTFLFAFIALGFLFGKWLGSSAGGFALVMLIYLVALIILIACRKSIVNRLKNRFLKELDPDLADEAQYEAKQAHKAQMKREAGAMENIHKGNLYETD